VLKEKPPEPTNKTDVWRGFADAAAKILKGN